MKKNIVIKKVEKGFYKVFIENSFIGFIEKISAHKWQYMYMGFWEEPVATMKECVEVFEKNYN